MSSSRIAAAIASLPHTRFDGMPGTGRSISLPAAPTGFSDGISTATSLASAPCAQLRRIMWGPTGLAVTYSAALPRGYPAVPSTRGRPQPSNPPVRQTGQLYLTYQIGFSRVSARDRAPHWGQRTNPTCPGGSRKRVPHFGHSKRKSRGIGFVRVSARDRASHSGQRTIPTCPDGSRSRIPHFGHS